MVQNEYTAKNHYTFSWYLNIWWPWSIPSYFILKLHFFPWSLNLYSKLFIFRWNINMHDLYQVCVSTWCSQFLETSFCLTYRAAGLLSSVFSQTSRSGFFWVSFLHMNESSVHQTRHIYISLVQCYTWSLLEETYRSFPYKYKSLSSSDALCVWYLKAFTLDCCV